VPQFSPSDQTQAVEFARSAAQAYKEGRYEDAIRDFQAANKLQPDPTLDINIGRCYEKLNKIPEALLHCKIALNARSASSKVRTAARLCVDRVQKQMARPKLSVTSIPSGATVRVDGIKVGKTPWNAEVAPGRRQIDLEFAEYRPYARTILTERNKEYTLMGTLIPNTVGAMLTVTSVPAGAQVSLDGQIVGATPIYRMAVEVKSYTVEISRDGFVPQVVSVSLADGSHLERTFTLVPTEGGLGGTSRAEWPGWALVGTGAAMAGLGGYFGYRALSNRNRARDLATTSGSRSDRREYDQSVDKFHSSQLAADLLYVGALLTTTGGIFVLTWP